MAMRIDEVRAMSTEDLMDELEDLREEIYRLRFQKEAGTSSCRWAKNGVSVMRNGARSGSREFSRAISGTLDGASPASCSSSRNS